MSESLTNLQCGECGVHHAIPTKIFESKREAGGFWFCPNGHQWGFKEGKHEREAIRRERDLLKQQLAQKDDEIAGITLKLQGERNRTAAYKGEMTKVKNRAKAGVCPCCNRTFQNMASHMKTKHPGFDPKVVNLDDKRSA